MRTRRGEEIQKEGRTCEDKTISEVNRADDEGCEESQKEVPKPVRCGGKCTLLSARTRGEGLADEDPYSWTPGHGVAPDEHTRGHDHHWKMDENFV